uniref:Uncharacterized protein n=1 Tax=Rhizophora mucronata TaxID=61149 RepID=A0A2P2KCQ1_RHIMU
MMQFSGFVFSTGNNKEPAKKKGEKKERKKSYISTKEKITEISRTFKKQTKKINGKQREYVY